MELIFLFISGIRVDSMWTNQNKAQFGQKKKNEDMATFFFIWQNMSDFCL